MRKLRSCLFAAGLALVCPFWLLAQKELDTAALRLTLHKYATRLHISAADADNAVITSSYFEKETGIRYIYLQQSWQQLNVFNSVLSLSFKNNSLVYASGKFIDSLPAKAGSASPSVAPDQALVKTAEHLQLKAPDHLRVMANRMATRERRMVFSPSGIAKRNIEATLVWVSADEGATVHLAWNVNIDVLGSTDWWNVRIDAASGTVINKDNLTIHEAQPAPADDRLRDAENTFPAAAAPIIAPARVTAPPSVTNSAYYVVPFPYESPNHGSPATDNEPWLKASSYNTNAITWGWHFDGTTNYDITRGNNVFAFLDYDATNAPNAATNWPDTSTTSTPALTFTHTPDLLQRPFTTINRRFAVDNLFYWNNLMHDVFYQYGFTEPAGNFQADNMGRGGAGNDYVNAQAQDGAGTSNANFTTPIDGTSGRMRMYQFPKPLVFLVNSPGGVAGNYTAAESLFSVNNLLMNIGSVTGQLVYYNDDAGGTTHLACNPPANTLTGFIALIDRGTCGGGFVQKVKNAQDAGAIAVVVVNNVAGAPSVMGGSDNTIIIPAVMISQADGATLAAQLASNVNITLSRAVGYDGDIDNGVICHEYGHGISNRLTGGPANTSCLINAEQAGEGWSDYMALMMTTNWAAASLTDGALPHPMGTYVVGQPVTGGGIRRFPYSTNMGIDPLTYTYMASSGEVHNIGEIWCSALWDMTWNIIQQTGSITTNIYNSAGAGGNSIALQLVVTGMKLQPCSPGFIDSRNAILAADSILYNSAHKCAIWNAFAGRGMGFSASEGSSNSTSDQTVAFDVPSGAVLTKSVTPLSLSSGGQVTITHTATCSCQSPLNGYTINDTIPTGFTYISSSGGTLSGNVVTFSPVNFATAQEAKTFSVTLQAAMSGCLVDSTINDNRDGLTAGGLSSAVISGSTGWTTSPLYANSGSNAWNGPDVSTPNNTTLTSNAFTVGPLSIMSFWHYFNTEGTYDGGVVELSTNGTTWTDAAPYIIEYPYTTTMDASTILSGRKAYSGSNVSFQRTTINLTPFAGQSLRIRFRMTSDNGVGSDGWFIDNIVVANGCGGMLKSGMLDASALRADTSVIPVYVTSSFSLPLTLLQFNAGQAGREVLLAWQTSHEINTASFEVQRSSDGLGWLTMGAVAAITAGNGNYQLYDNSPLNGVNYYRLKMIDKDQRFTFSQVRQVTLKDNGSFVMVPNPADGATVVHFNRVLLSPELSLYGAGGGLLRHTRLSGNASYYTLSTAQLPAGIYTVSVRSGSNVFFGKLVVVH